MTISVAIVGAGPCGLTLARLLHCKGIDYTIYEQQESAKTLVASGSLDIHEETGQLALREAGLYERFAEHARWEDDKVTFFDFHGNALWHHGGDAQAWKDGVKTGGRPEIDRIALRDILLESIPQKKVHWNHKLASVELNDASQPVLKFTNGTVASGFSLVVGTDGAWSKVRKIVTSTKPQYSGGSYLETRIYPDNELHKTLSDGIGHGMGLYLDGPRQMIVQRQGDNSYRIYFGIRVPEGYLGTEIDPNDQQATCDTLLSSFYSHWDESLKAYIRGSDNFRSWPLYQVPAGSMDWKSVPGVTLAGDAAHLALPNGEGVNLAMQDALELVSKIVEHGESALTTAVEEYERAMMKRGQDHILDGEQMAQLMGHPEGASGVVKGFRAMAEGKAMN